MRRRGWTAACLAAASMAATATEPVTQGPEIDYQAAVVRADDGARIVVFERLAPATLSGDLWLTRSTDDGASWSAPAPIVATAANERHPALLRSGPDEYLLFYLKGTGGISNYRIWRATSSGGGEFTEQAPVDLGWATGGEINPHVIRHADGTLTMSYQRGSAAYVAQSSDDGATWDTQRTQIAGNALLPRIAYRESDGLYLASYQVNPGDDALQMFVKTTTDPLDWSGAAQDFALDGNHHDSLPVVMPDGAFALFWIRAAGSGFDLAVRRSVDGTTWGETIAITDTPDQDDVEPHPLVGASATSVELYWGRDDPAGSMTYDIVRRADVPVVDVDTVFADGFEAG